MELFSLWGVAFCPLWRSSLTGRDLPLGMVNILMLMRPKRSQKCAASSVRGTYNSLFFFFFFFFFFYVLCASRRGRAGANPKHCFPGRSVGENRDHFQRPFVRFFFFFFLSPLPKSSEICVARTTLFFFFFGLYPPPWAGQGTTLSSSSSSSHCYTPPLGRGRGSAPSRMVQARANCLRARLPTICGFAKTEDEH